MAGLGEAKVLVGLSDRTAVICSPIRQTVSVNVDVDYHSAVSCTDPKVPTAKIGNLFNSDFTCFETRVFVPSGQGMR